MEVNHLSELKPRTVWEITDDAFDLYRERFVLLASISAVVFVPAMVFYNAIAIGAFHDLTRMSDGPGYLESFLSKMAVAMPVFGIAYVLQFGATALAVRDTLSGEPTTLASTYKRTFRRFWGLLFAAILIGLLGLVSVCTYIGPVFVAAYFAFISHGILLEDRKMWDAIKRSRDLAQSFFGKSFGLLCLMGCVSLLLAVGFNSVIAFAFTLFPNTGGQITPYQQEETRNIVQLVSSSIITLLVAPLPAIATTLLYYDLRVRREGLDIEAEAERMEVPLAPDPFGGVLNPKLPKAKGMKR